MAKHTANAGLAVGDFVHLHNHTQYSLLDGLTKIPQLLDFVKTSGMDAVAMTDHGTLSGAIEFYKECKARGVKPIIGIETYVAARKHTDKDPQKDKNRFHLIVLAMNNTGYQNLMRLSTVANMDGFYYFPRVDHELLERYNEGLIVLSACMGGEIGSALKEGDVVSAEKIARWYKGVFGDRYYLEIQDHGHPDNPNSNDEQRQINEAILALGKRLGIPVVVTCDAHYLQHEDQDAHEVLLCVGTGAFLADENRMSLKDFPLHVTPPKEIISRWGSSHPEVVLNTKAIAERCNVEIELGKILIPKFPVPDGETEKSYLTQLVYRGLAHRYGGISEPEAAKLQFEDAKKALPTDIADRAAYELQVIDSMGFNGYFLIIWDFIKWGKDKGIVFGPGRGSAAGSIIAYALRITELDPIKYDLLFERFLNPDRISMPDIDIDIQDTRRDEVIQYCIEKYGSDRVANIVTFGRMAARAAVRDVARVLQVPYADADRIAKMIPPPVQGRHVPLERSIQESPELHHEYESNQAAKQVFDMAVRLEGTIRSHGVHAAGVVIAPGDIVKYTPLEMAQKGVVTTQYSMGPIEDLGLLKMDFLGLSNLTIIKNALRIIRKVYGKDIDIATIPLDDKKTYELFQRGDTTGVFQLESSGMKRYLKELKPTVFDDIIAMVALYRPGPLAAGLTDKFIARKNGLEQVSYDHHLMETALKTTYGVLVYQEQVMQIAKDMCGFTGGEADTLRKAVGKKIREMMAKLRDKIVQGAVDNGVEKRIAEKFWKDLEGFADYAFNKSHAACYALIAYHTAYLKANYPEAFMAALMTSDYDDTDRLAIEINECRHVGIDVLPPDVNESFVEFAVVPKSHQIRFGMAAIKNVGTGAVEEILRARSIDGAFKSLEDFLSKVNCRIVNRKALESLVKSGAFDRFGDRGQLYNNLEVMLAYANRVQKAASSGQTDLFGNSQESGEDFTPKLVLDETLPPIPDREQLLWERELLGLYLSRDPLQAFETFLAEHTVPLNTIKQEHDKRSVTVGGSINDKREITTKNGQKMAFIKVADQFDEIELVLFPSIYQQTIDIWDRDRVVLVKGKVTARDRDGNVSEEVKILVDDAREITSAQAAAYQPTGKKHKPLAAKRQKVAQSAALSAAAPPVTDITERVYIRLTSTDDQEVLTRLKQTIDEHQGETEVVLVLGPPDNKQIIKLPMRMTRNDIALDRLQSLVGENNVRVQ